MQVHPIEVWDLLDLLGLPPEWDRAGVPRLLRAGQRAESVRRGAGSHGPPVPGRRTRAGSGVARRRRAPDRSLPPEGRHGAARAARRGEHSPPQAGDARAPGGDSGPARAHADSASDLPAHARAAAPLRRRRAARDPHRGPAGRRPFRRPERGGARPLRRRGGVHLADLPAGVRRGAVGGRLRHDDLPAPPRQQLRGPAGDVREAPRRLAVRDRRVDGGRGGGRARRRGPRRGSGRGRPRRPGHQRAGRRGTGRDRPSAGAHPRVAAGQQAREPDRRAGRSDAGRLPAGHGVHAVHGHHGLPAARPAGTRRPAPALLLPDAAARFRPLPARMPGAASTANRSSAGSAKARPICCCAPTPPPRG